MFEGLNVLHEIARVSAWTGLSAGVLVGLGALAWFVAPARLFALAAGLVIIAGYGGTLYGNHAGRADVTRQWDAANSRAAVAAKARDDDAARAAAASYEPVIAAHVKTIADLKRQVDLDEQKLLAAKIGVSGKSGGACALGDDPVRLRARSARR